MRLILNKDSQVTDYEQAFSQYLERRGLKLTKPRRQILDSVFAVHEHFDAEQLHARMKSLSGEISLATIYRTLPLLVEAGLIQLSLRSASRDVFEHIFGHPKHIHWVCQKCGRVQETSLDELNKVLGRDAEKIRFQPQETSVQVRGLCWQCRAEPGGKR